MSVLRHAGIKRVRFLDEVTPGNMFAGMADEIHVYADGAFDAASGSGGWGIAAYHGDLQIHAAHGSASGPSNNSLEVLAAVNALLWIETQAVGRASVLRTDSLHVVEGCNRWRPIWRHNGWKRINPNPQARKRAIPDADLWRQLDALLERHPLVTVEWCPGHSGRAGNEQAHALASSALERQRHASPGIGKRPPAFSRS